MSDYDSECERALLLDAETFAQGQTPALSIALPDRPFTKPENAAYLEAKVLFNRDTRSGVGSNPLSRVSGILQINVVTPKNDGPTPGTKLAGKIKDHYRPPSLKQLTTVSGHVVRLGPQLPYRGNALPEDGWVTIVVSIPWWSDRPPI